MSTVRPALSGGRFVEISPSRVSGWFDRFAERHSGVAGTEVCGDTVTVRAQDDVTASITTGFPSLGLVNGRTAGLAIGDWSNVGTSAGDLAGSVEILVTQS